MRKSEIWARLKARKSSNVTMTRAGWETPSGRFVQALILIDPLRPKFEDYVSAWPEDKDFYAAAPADINYLLAELDAIEAKELLRAESPQADAALLRRQRDDLLILIVEAQKIVQAAIFAAGGQGFQANRQKDFVEMVKEKVNQILEEDKIA